MLAHIFTCKVRQISMQSKRKGGIYWEEKPVLASETSAGHILRVILTPFAAFGNNQIYFTWHFLKDKWLGS